ncbi:MAG: hypothetical protein MUE36_13180 [Acidimicrobiales bacterium]|nr:hypothetical protein [Acidimicrobiales bacterium]
MDERPALGPLYRAVRLRVTELLETGPPGDGSLPVPATPAWTVHDVLAHLVGITVGAAGPVPPQGPDDDWTARQVEWGRGMTVPALLATWTERAEAFESGVDRPQIVIDAVTHEHDLRGALGRPGSRDDDATRWASALLVKGISVPTSLVVRTESGDTPARTSGGDSDAEPVVVTTTDFELLRWRMGRRSRRQMAAMDWSADPEPFLDHLAVFGPSPLDIVE